MDLLAILLLIGIGCCGLVFLLEGIRMLGDFDKSSTTLIGAILCILGGTLCGVVGMVFLGLV